MSLNSNPFARVLVLGDEESLRFPKTEDPIRTGIRERINQPIGDDTGEQEEEEEEDSQSGGKLHVRNGKFYGEKPFKFSQIDCAFLCREIASNSRIHLPLSQLGVIEFSRTPAKVLQHVRNRLGCDDSQTCPLLFLSIQLPPLW
ncbi:hypothetical protein RUM43_010161 [Polyplax serrata]|uniref:Uncharacterized protein n=1 Tax=Polyplax serrata TaxID=468196 RepID=A0AAN8P8S6_POLSC